MKKEVPSHIRDTSINENKDMVIKKTRINIYDFLTKIFSQNNNRFNILLNLSHSIYFTVNKELFEAAIFNLIGELKFLSAPHDDCPVDVSYKEQDGFITLLILLHCPKCLAVERNKRCNKDFDRYNNPSPGLLVSTARTIIQVLGGQLSQENIPKENVGFFIKLPVNTNENLELNEQLTNNYSN
jgi:K+-sensing histidine kinase KdpD